jgi:hypothetical protein
VGPLLGLVKKFTEGAATGPVPANDRGLDGVDFLAFRHQVPIKVGNWRLFPPEVKPDASG